MINLIEQFLNIETTFFTILNYPMSYIEFFGTVLNILSVRLVARNKIRTRPIGIIAVSLFMILFFQIQLYSDMIEQWYFIVTGCYGRRVWHKRKRTEEIERNLTFTNKKENLVYTIAIILWTAIFAYGTSQLHIRFPKVFNQSASFPIIDAFTTVVSFAAMIMMAHKKITCRFLRITVDILAIRLYFTKGVYFIAIEYILFLILASRWLRKRRKIYQQQNTRHD